MILKILLLIILILINGILSASEIAFLSLDKYDIARKRNKKAKMIMKCLDDESKFLSTIQVGITLVTGQAEITPSTSVMQTVS